MPDTITVDTKSSPTIQTTQVQNIPVQKQQEPIKSEPVVQEPDLITKVTKFTQQAKVSLAQDNLVDIGFDFKKIEEIKDPVAKKWAEDAYKSMQSGATRKFQEVSQIKKEAEEKIKQAEEKLKGNSNWTPERIQSELLNNPQFLTAAQQVGKVSSVDEGSLLSEAEQAKMKALESELMNIKQANYTALINSEDANLKSRYDDYDPNRIDGALIDVIKMQPHKLREYVYRATYHDDHVKAAYELGKQDVAKLNQDRINGSSVLSNQQTVSSQSPIKEKGESDQAFFIRIAQNRLAQSKR